MPTLNDLQFDDLEGALDVARDLHRKRRLTADYYNTLTRSFTDPTEFLQRIQQEEVHPNAPPHPRRS